MARPKVTVVATNDNLNIQGPTDFGTCVVMVAAPVAPVAGYGVAFQVKSAAEAATAFVQTGNEKVVTAFEYFFAEAPVGTEVNVVAMARTTTLEALVATANIEKGLNSASGKARLVGVIKFPDTGVYTPTITTGFDVDVHNAVEDAQTIAATWGAKPKGFRVMIEGYGFTTVSAAKDYSSEAFRNVAVVVGKVDGETSYSLMLALGRAAKVQPQENIGKVKSGSLVIGAAVAVTIAGTAPEAVSSTDLDSLHTKRYITFEKNEEASGYVFNDDNMLCDPTDDYNNLRHGRIMDNITRIAYSTYYHELKDDVEVDDDGRMDSAVEKSLETSVESNIDDELRNQLSKKNGIANVDCLVNPDATAYASLYAKAGISSPNFNIIETGTVYLFILAQPKGCIKQILAYCGFTATTTA
jgi:hypothetical protein